MIVVGKLLTFVDLHGAMYFDHFVHRLLQKALGCACSGVVCLSVAFNTVPERSDHCG